MVHRNPRRAAWLLLALAAAAPVAAQQTVRLPARDVTLQDRPASVFTVGTEEGRDWEMFSGVRNVAFDAADNLYVLDGQNHRVVVFDARGRHVRHFGKRGGGPGELQAPFNLALDSDGNVIVSDVANRAYVIFRPTGEYLRNVPFPENFGLPVGGLFSDGRGSLITRVMPRPVREANEPADDFTTILRQPLQQRATPTALYRIAIPPAQEQQVSGGVVRMRMDPVFGPRPLFAPLASGALAVQHEPHYSVKVLDPSGRAVRTLVREFPLRRVTQRDRETWQERRNSNPGAAPTAIMMTMGPGGSSTTVGSPGAARAAGAAEAMRMNMDNTPFAETMAVVTGLRSDAQGRLWIQRRHQDNTDAGPIDIVTADGRYTGTLPAQPLPDAFSASGLAAWIVRDELGVERIAVRRLPQSWR